MEFVSCRRQQLRIGASACPASPDPIFFQMHVFQADGLHLRRAPLFRFALGRRAGDPRPAGRTKPALQDTYSSVFLLACLIASGYAVTLQFCTPKPMISDGIASISFHFSASGELAFFETHGNAILYRALHRA